MTSYFRQPRIIAILCTLMIVSCSYFTKKDDPSPKEYNLTKPEKFTMPESLMEISGICFYKGRNDTVYAIQDENGKLFRLAWKESKQYHAHYGSTGDYEDVTILKNKVVVLKSNGHFYVFDFADATEPEVDSVQIWKHLLPEGEYESIYGNDSTGKVYVLCKNCEGDNIKKSSTGYIFDLRGDSLVAAGSFQVDVTHIASIAGKVKRGFRPSGLAQNPITGEWFIISAVNKLLVITDANWKVKEAYPLNGNTFNQPEGIAFDKAGNLYISNEGSDLSSGNIYKINRLTR